MDVAARCELCDEAPAERAPVGGADAALVVLAHVGFHALDIGEHALEIARVVFVESGIRDGAHEEILAQLVDDAAECTFPIARGTWEEQEDGVVAAAEFVDEHCLTFPFCAVRRS